MVGVLVIIIQAVFVLASSLELHPQPSLSHQTDSDLPEFCQSLRQNQANWKSGTAQIYSQFCGRQRQKEFVWQGPCDTTDRVTLENRLKNDGSYDCRIMAWHEKDMRKYFVDFVEDLQTTEAKEMECDGECLLKVKEIHGNLKNGKIFFLPPVAPPHKDFDTWVSRGGGHGYNNNNRELPILSRVPRSTQKPLGSSHKIKCVDRNSESELDSNGRFLTLCRSCWSIRVLPPKYFPKYINENICDGVQCLSNVNDTYGECRQQTMQVDVLQNLGSDSCPKWEKEKLTIRTGCSCSVKTYSEKYMTPADYFFQIFETIQPSVMKNKSS